MSVARSSVRSIRQGGRGVMVEIWPDPTPSPEPRGAPQRPATRDEEPDQREGEQRRPPPVDQERGRPGDHRDPHEHRRRSCDEHPIERAAAGAPDTPVLAPHPPCHVGRGHVVAGAFAGPPLLPAAGGPPRGRGGGPPPPPPPPPGGGAPQAPP